MKGTRWVWLFINSLMPCHSLALGILFNCFQLGSVYIIVKLSDLASFLFLTSTFHVNCFRINHRPLDSWSWKGFYVLCSRALNSLWGWLCFIEVVNVPTSLALSVHLLRDHFLGLKCFISLWSISTNKKSIFDMQVFQTDF